MSSMVEYSMGEYAGPYKGTIALATGSKPRYNQFYDCYTRLIQQHPDWKLVRIEGLFTAENRNIAVQKSEGDYIFFMDDDMFFRPDHLKLLLVHDVDIVGPLYLQRNAPFHSIISDHHEGQWYRHYLGPHMKGLREVDGIGGGGMLVKRHVFDKLPQPWFDQPRESDGNLISDDYYFCRNAREHGFKIFVDLEHPMGHLQNCIITPLQDETGEWSVLISVGGGQVRVPVPKGTLTIPQRAR